MQSAGLRRPKKTHHVGEPSPHSCPRYTIDLSLKPSDRYKEVAKDFELKIRLLPTLFDQVVQGLHSHISIKTVRWLARFLLRRLHNYEETEELRGIHEVTGLEMHLLIAFNVLLDLFMGCTSGGARVKANAKDYKMLHFRTLDWGMEELRSLIVRFDFMDRLKGTRLASSVTYVGFVGVLTGVKNGLSMSLNFRPTHESRSRLTNFKFYFHHLLVLLGLRPSISSLLRQCLLPALYLCPIAGFSGTLESILHSIPPSRATAAYLIFSDGDRTVALEKDYRQASVSSSEQFIVVCNHDVSQEKSVSSSDEAVDIQSTALKALGMEELVRESISRKNQTLQLWKNALGRRKQGLFPATTAERIFKWMDTYPIANEETHFACVMDPKGGDIVWIKYHPNPIQ